MKFKDKISNEHFKHMCSQENNIREKFTIWRITKTKFRNFISVRYGSNIAEKLQYILDFN